MAQAIPMCWKCSDGLLEKQAEGALIVRGCKADKLITDYEQAKVHCPLLIKTAQ